MVTTNPYDSSNAENKKRVRSVAALKSWPERRKRTFEQYEKSGEKPGAFLVEAPKPSSSKTASKLEVQQPRPRRPALPTPTESVASTSSEVVSLDAALVSEPCSREKTPDLPCQCIRCKLDKYVPRRRHAIPRTRRRLNDGGSAWRNDLAMLTPPSSPHPGPSPPASDMADPFNRYPVPYNPFYDRVLHHMLTVFAPRGWPALKITRDQGLKWEWFMTQHALADPALFFVRLLFATGDLIKLGVLDPSASLYLRAEAIKAINEALADPIRATSDPLILAVGRIALHESMYGDRHAANTMHRPAQQRMIQMRGGMQALEYPPLVKRLMRWADTVMSKQGGTDRFLEDEENVRNFSMTESVEVLEKWVPSEGRALRSQIKISDLVND